MAKILLIDDDDELTDFLAEALGAHDHEVHCVPRAEEGLEVLTAARPPFRLVLLDVNLLGGMSGIEFLEVLRARAVSVPVVLVTGDDTSDMAIEATKLGAYDYVVKPYDFQSLVRKLEPIIAETLKITEPLPDVPLPPEAAPHPGPGASLIGPSDAMRRVYRDIGRFAQGDDSVLILGETGTGKELVARALHTHSARKHKLFVPLNCAAFPENLLETELFGHEKGAFTGAEKLRKGKFEYADGGTLFLDEIGDMPLTLQATLLRVLQERELVRVGGNEPIKVNVRILSATRHDLEAAVEEGRFRIDLFYRLNVMQIDLPPLRDRLEDLPRLAAHFLARAAEEKGRTPPSLSDAALDKLRGHRWPGNIRELENVMKRAFGVCRGPQILLGHLPEFRTECAADDGGGLDRAIERFFDGHQERVWPLLRDLVEKELLRVALEKLDGNQMRVHKRLAMSRNTVIDRIEKYGLK